MRVSVTGQGQPQRPVGMPKPYAPCADVLSLKRIALYCLDQMAYHDEEMRTRLVEQQLILQRVEWKVYEINGCLFEHNAEAVMERVVDFIEAVGVGGADAGAREGRAARWI